MKPNKFSKLAQKSLTLTAQIVLIVIAVATIFAIAQEIGHVWEAGSIAVGDLLMLFLYLGDIDAKSLFRIRKSASSLSFIYWYYFTSALSSSGYQRH
jgi:hypothetical protein